MGNTLVCSIWNASLGVLACLDGYMNIALEQTEEYVNGQLKNKYGDAFIRGNNGRSLMFTVASYELSMSVPTPVFIVQILCTTFSMFCSSLYQHNSKKMKEDFNIHLIFSMICIIFCTIHTNTIIHNHLIYII